MYILGISAFYHDSAAALICDGVIVAAAQEERFTRKKHDAGFPHQALDYCLSQAGIGPSQLDQVVFYEKPILNSNACWKTISLSRPVASARSRWPYRFGCVKSCS